MHSPDNSISRRRFLRNSALGTISLPLLASQSSIAQPLSTPPMETESSGPSLHWLDGPAPAEQPGTTWGVPWPQGHYPQKTRFALFTPDRESVPLQTWPIAFWPDESLKWTAHAIPAGLGRHTRLYIAPGNASSAPETPVIVTQAEGFLEIDTGSIRCRIPRTGNQIVETIRRGSTIIGSHGHLVLHLQQGAADRDAGVAPLVENYTSEVEELTLEQEGPVRVVVKQTGCHVSADGRRRFPFVLRWYAYAGGESLRLVHSFILDGPEEDLFVRGLGFSFNVPLRDQPHNRHIRFAGEENGLWGEAVQGLTGLRRDPGEGVRRAQVAGRETPPVETFPTTVGPRMRFIPQWGDFSLSQLSADGFQIRKRTKAGHGWIPAGAGRRAHGLGYVGGTSGGMAFGLRDFWQRHPTQLDIRAADTDTAKVTIWLWSPDAPPMDLRFYHDGLGISGHAEELEAMQITYEDFEPEFGTAVGKGRTSEMMLWAFGATPTRERLLHCAATISAPPLLCVQPAYLASTRAFGTGWTPEDRSTPEMAQLEERNDFLLRYFMEQRDIHRWYGFWDYGDFMHTYDPDRHVWRYDVGGYAWANSELSPDLWLWYSFLRSGRADCFRLAEAMTRHTGEVDVYHAGRFRGLGTRHNVQHWGCSAKQVRISNALYRRFYYFLTADERTGDLMAALVDSHLSFTRLDPIRKIRTGPPPSPDPRRLSIGMGTDWGSLAAAWLIAWERTGDEALGRKLREGMRSIGQLPNGFFTAGVTFDSFTGAFTALSNTGIGVSHLSAVFGLVEVCAELIDLLPETGFESAWLQYCKLYNAGPEAQTAALGRSLGSLNLGQGHSRLTAFAAYRLKDSKLADRAWREFYEGRAGFGPRTPWKTSPVENGAALETFEEAPWVSTNAASQWGLAAFQLHAWAGQHQPPLPQT